MLKRTAKWCRSYCHCWQNAGRNRISAQTGGLQCHPGRTTGTVQPNFTEGIQSLTGTALCEQVLSHQLEDSEKRCQQLIDSSKDAIAYVHECMHILSNDPYFKIFGYESRDDIEAMPIMDLVASDDSTKLKEFLRRFFPR